MISRAVCIAVTGVLMFCGRRTGATSVVESGKARQSRLSLRRNHGPGDPSGHLLLRRQLAPRRGGRRILRHPGQQPQGAPHDLLHLGHFADAPSDVTYADPKTIFNRFGGEGEGAHTHMLWDWKVGDTFQFFVRKPPGAAPGTTDAGYYIYDRQAKSGGTARPSPVRTATRRARQA